MKKFAIRMMISAYKSAKEYHDEAIMCEDVEGKEVFKQLALAEIEEFDKLSHLYNDKAHHEMKEHEHDYWLEFFKGEVAEIKHAIHEIA